MSFVCDLCKKQFKSPKSLNYHQNKKVCEKFKCKNCNKIFTRNESLKYHLLNQVCGIKKIDNDSETGLKKIENDSETGFRKIDNDSETGFKKKEPFTGGASPQTSPDKEGGSWGEAPQPKSNKEGGLLGDSPIAPVGSSKKYLLKKKVNQKPKPPNRGFPPNLTKLDLYEENLKLKGELKALKENPHNINNIDKQQINNFYIEVPPAFLTLDTFPTMMKMLPDLLPKALSKHPTEFVSFLIKETNCNPKRPIFNSAQITNKKDPYAKISNGEEFIYVPKKQVILKLIENKKSLLQEYVDKNGDKYGERILKRYQNYLDLLDEDKETIMDLETEITCMLLNISRVIGTDDWSKELLDDLKSYDD